MARSDRGHGGVDDPVDGRGVGQRSLVQVAQGAAANAGSLAGAKRDLDGDVLSPTRAQFPGLVDSLGDGPGPLA